MGFSYFESPYPSILFSVPLTEGELSDSFLIPTKDHFYKAFLELIHHMLTCTSYIFFCTYILFSPVFIVLWISHLKQTMSS